MMRKFLIGSLLLILGAVHGFSAAQPVGRLSSEAIADIDKQLKNEPDLGILSNYLISKNIEQSTIGAAVTFAYSSALKLWIELREKDKHDDECLDRVGNYLREFGMCFVQNGNQDNDERVNESALEARNRLVEAGGLE
jgi:hypothetical protein